MDIEKIKVGDVIHDIRDAGALREIEGKGLSTNDYTNTDKSKLEGIEADAQKNKIESIKVNGSDVTPDHNKAVNVTVPTKMSDLNLDGGNMASGASLRFKNASSSMVIQPFGIVKESNNQSHLFSFPDRGGTVALTSDIPDVSGKQDTIQDLSEIRSGAALGATAYQKPLAGIPASDMTLAVQNSLEFAVSSLQKTAQTLTAAEKAQVWNNLGIKEGVSRVVSTLPTTEIDENIVYLVPTANAGEFTEYKYNGSSWDNLGTFTVQAPTVVNDLETGGSTSALSAEMGKVLDGRVSQLSQDVTDLETDLEGGEVSIPIDIGTNTDNIGYYNKTTGKLSANSSYRYYPPVNLSEYVGKTLQMEVEWAVAPSSSYDNAICIFTSTDNVDWADSTPKGYVGEYQLYSMREGAKATLITTVEKPFLRISTHKNSGCTISVEVISTSAGRVPTLETKVETLETNLVSKIDKGSVTPKDIKQTPFIEDFRFCTILPNKAVSSVTTIEGKTYIYWSDPTTDWYTIAINIQSYKDLVLVSDILPQSTISRFLTVGIDTGGTNIEFVAWVDSNETFSLSPNAYVFYDEKMTITLSALFLTYGYKGNIVLYIKMPTAYKINWLASGMQLEGYDWMKIGSYAKADLKKELKADNIKIVLPSKIYAAVGHEMNLYKDSFILCDDSDRYGLIASFGSLTPAHKGQNERFTFTPTEANSGVDCTIGVYDKVTLETIATKTFKLYVKAVTQPTAKVIFIGDSMTDRCIYPAEICQELGGGNLTSLGTRHDTLTYQGSNGVVSVDMDNEGRGGWSANDYCTKATDGTITNAFWNPTSQAFDFAYYMSQNGFSSVDCVVIALGTNDIGKNMLASDFDTIIGNFRTMVDSIHTYSSAIKVVISLTPHGAEPDGWAAAVYSDRSTEYNYLQFTLVEKLIAEFEAEANVFLAPTYLNIDHHNDYPTASVAISERNPEVVKRQINNVHFSVDSTTPVSQCWGYLKMADAIWYTMLAALT